MTMRTLGIRSACIVLLLAGCAGPRYIKPAETLDERTGVTVGALQEPIELVESLQTVALAGGKRTSFAYLGPVEWDRSGEISYGLWIHIAPGNDKQAGDIHARGSAQLILDDGKLALSPIDAPKSGHGPYQPIAAWGQTAYFDLDVATLKRLAASQKLVLECPAADGTTIDFLPSHETHTTLTQFLHARGITDD